MYTVDRRYHGVTTQMPDCKDMSEAVNMIEADRKMCDGDVVYHIVRDDGSGIGDEMEFCND